MIAWERVKAGDVLYDVRRTKIGNTTMTQLQCWDVRVLEIDHAAGRAVVSWNSNKPTTYHRSQIVRLRRSRPSHKKRGIAL